MNYVWVSLTLLTWLLKSSTLADYAPEVGKFHDDFVLPRIADRQPVRLSDFRGKKLLLIQFASW